MASARRSRDDSAVHFWNAFKLLGPLKRHAEELAGIAMTEIQFAHGGNGPSLSGNHLAFFACHLFTQLSCGFHLPSD